MLRSRINRVTVSVNSPQSVSQDKEAEMMLMINQSARVTEQTQPENQSRFTQNKGEVQLQNSFDIFAQVQSSLVMWIRNIK